MAFKNNNKKKKQYKQETRQWRESSLTETRERTHTAPSANSCNKQRAFLSQLLNYFTCYLNSARVAPHTHTHTMCPTRAAAERSLSSRTASVQKPHRLSNNNKIIISLSLHTAALHVQNQQLCSQFIQQHQASRTK